MARRPSGSNRIGGRIAGVVETVSLFGAIIDLGWLTLALVWAGTIAAVRGDARARLANGAGVRAATVLAAWLPYVGAVVWLSLRPAETRAVRRERRLRRLVLEQELTAREERLRRAPEPGPPVPSGTAPQPAPASG